MLDLEEIQEEANEAAMQRAIEMLRAKVENYKNIAPRLGVGMNPADVVKPEPEPDQCPTCRKWGVITGAWSSMVESPRCAGCTKHPAFCSCR